MSKRYTAQEMRTTADFICTDITFARVPVQYERPLYRDVKAHEVADMLRQAADAMDKLPSVIESRLGRAEKRQKRDLANELHDYLTWTQPITGKPEVCFADLEKLGKLWERLRKDADSIESEWEEVKDGGK